MYILKSLLHKYRYLRYPNYKKKYIEKVEKGRLLNIPRYTEGTFNIFKTPLKFVDGASCHFIYQEIFEQQIYKFETESAKPYIIDAGANIGLSVIYFKRLFPDASIIAFEPDPKVFKVLSDNMKSFGFRDVALLNRALWDEEITLEFLSEGADAGRVSTVHDKEKLIHVPAISLRSYLVDRKVDFLKIDIEGAELTVLNDCSDLLHHVENLFVEYHSFIGEAQRLDELLALLRSAGFRYLIQQHGVVSNTPFLRTHAQNGMDILLNISAFRKNRKI